MLDIDLLQSFVAVVESRLFTRAAERVHRTQSLSASRSKSSNSSLAVALAQTDTCRGRFRSLKTERPSQSQRNTEACAGSGTVVGKRIESRAMSHRAWRISSGARPISWRASEVNPDI